MNFRSCGDDAIVQFSYSGDGKWKELNSRRTSQMVFFVSGEIGVSGDYIGAEWRTNKL